MTNEEAISRLHTIDGWGEREHEAIAMAIKALEQPEPCKDTVSRQAAKDIFTELYGISAIGSVFDKYEWADICETTANELPSAQPDIIHCKDCAYCDSDVVDAPYGMTKKIFWCDRLYAGANENLIVEPDDFCSFAERREDATD